MSYFLIHNGSADHTSEDRIRGICTLLPEQPEIWSAAPEEDWKYGLAQVGALSRNRPGAARHRVRPGDWFITAHPRATGELRSGVRRVLWGWEPTGPLPRHHAAQLNRFHRIIVTDIRSKQYLRQAGIRQSVRLGPDPSFLVSSKLRPHQEAFQQDTLGLCVSSVTSGFEVRPGLMFQSYCTLIHWVLKNTSWQIALIPYCASSGCSDHPLHAALKSQFPKEDRLFLREDGDCRELRGDLSLCRCCVGTAGVPAAWSCGVPGLCIGASRRVQSLSATLFGSRREGVVRVSSLERPEELTTRFREFLGREDSMRRWLELSVPRYRQWTAQWPWQE